MVPGQQAELNAKHLVDAIVPNGPPDAALRAFDDLFATTAAELGVLIGARGVSAVLQRALTLAGKHNPLLQSVGVGSRGLSLERLGRSSPEDLAMSLKSLRELYLVFSDVACSLIGTDLVSSVLSQAEQSVKRD